MAEQVYDKQPFPLEKEPREDLVPLFIPPPTTLPATTTDAPCDLSPYLCTGSVVIPTTTE